MVIYRQIGIFTHLKTLLKSYPKSDNIAKIPTYGD